LGLLWKNSLSPFPFLSLDLLVLLHCAHNLQEIGILIKWKEILSFHSAAGALKNGQVAMNGAE
jgi:hypothetical protein